MSYEEIRKQYRTELGRVVNDYKLYQFSIAASHGHPKVAHLMNDRRFYLIQDKEQIFQEVWDEAQVIREPATRNRKERAVHTGR